MKITVYTKILIVKPNVAEDLMNTYKPSTLVKWELFKWRRWRRAVRPCRTIQNKYKVLL